MKMRISEEDILRMAKASINTVFRTIVADVVARNFRSIHYVSSKLLCDCIVLNLVLNHKISPDSANEIITCIRRTNRAFYTTVDSAYYPLADKFEEHAKTVLGDSYSEVKALNMRATNYLVYVMSLELENDKRLNRNEVYIKTYTFAELEAGVPHY